MNVFAMLTIGTGIGGGYVVDGRLFRGSSDDAGDFGHHSIRDVGPPCVCGRIGCFEQYASTRALCEQYSQLSGTETKDARVIIDDFNAGQSIACVAVSAWIDHLASGIANLVTFINPEVVALGGAISQAATIYEPLREEVEALLLPASRGRLRLVAAQLGNNAGPIGAAYNVSMLTSQIENGRF